MSDVVSYLAAISTAAQSATHSLELMAAAGQGTASPASGSESTSGLPGGGSGLKWLGSSVTNTGSLDSGKVISAMKSLGGR